MTTSQKYSNSNIASYKFNTFLIRQAYWMKSCLMICFYIIYVRFFIAFRFK